MSAKRKSKVAEYKRLDLGCGKNVREGFEGVDIRDFGQKYVFNLVARALVDYIPLGCKKAVKTEGFRPWPWADGSVDEVHCSHFVEHLTAKERVHFANELHRVLKPGATALVIVPHWCSPRAYGDLTHQWPPITEWWFLYLNKGWRESQAPHNDEYTCDFEITYGYSLRADLATRSQDYQQYAMLNYKDACQDIISTWVRK